MSTENEQNYYLLDDSLAGKIALVTGGSRGIGRAICIALAAKGAQVAVHYRSTPDAADEVVRVIEGLGGEAFFLQADLAEREAGAALVEQVNKRVGGVDILVNNAGEMTDYAVEDMPDEAWERTLNVNLHSAFRCSRAVIPHMKAQQWGRIINITSQAAQTGSSNHAHYAASKSGLYGLTYSLAKELAPDNITVNQVAPGRIKTEMVMSRIAGREAEWMKQTPLGRLGDPEEIAAPVAFLASEAARYITGATLHINGGQLMN